MTDKHRASGHRTPLLMTRLCAWCFVVCALLATTGMTVGVVAQSAPAETVPTLTAQTPPAGVVEGRPEPRSPRPREPFASEESTSADWAAQLESIWRALLRLPLAAGLSAVLAFRPRRRGTPPRQASVIQTQIILAIVGAMVMLVVGASLARAFGIVGAAGLIRYRAKVDDPKDAGVMLATLALGLASGVGLYLLALFGTVFVLGVLWLIESIDPAPYTLFTLTVTVEDSAPLKSPLEDLFRQRRIPFEMRTMSPTELCYELKLPLTSSTDKVLAAIMRLHPDQPIDVKWEEKKEKKK